MVIVVTSRGSRFGKHRAELISNSTNDFISNPSRTTNEIAQSLEFILPAPARLGSENAEDVMHSVDRNETTTYLDGHQYPQLLIPSSSVFILHH